MRCPDCAKFVSMENADPEINELTATYDKESTSVMVSVSLRHARTCAECGNELKALDIDTDPEAFDITETEDYQALTPEQKVQFLEAMQDKDGDEVDIEEDSSESEESGGSRYKKNMITVTVNATVELDNGKEGDDKITVKVPVEIKSENAAGDYEEQV